MKSPSQLARLQLIRKPGRSLFLILIMAVSLGVSSSLLRLLLQSRQGLQGLALPADAIVGPKESSLDLLWEALTLQKSEERVIPYKLFETLKTSRAPGFEDGTPGQSLGPLVVVPAFLFLKDPLWFGTDFDFPKLQLGSVDGHWFVSDLDAVVGEDWAESHGLQIGSSLEGPGGTYKVTGILKTHQKPWSQTVFANFTKLRSVAQSHHLVPSTVWKEDVLDFFLIKGISPTQQASLESLINERTVAQILWLRPELEKLKDITGQSAALFQLIAILIGLLALTAFSGLLISEVQNLEVQILTLRAIGYSRRELYAWMTIEGLSMAAISLILGIALDFFITPVLQDSISSQLPVFRFETLPVWASSPLWIFILISVPLSLLIPMRKILGKSLSEALRK